VSDWNGDGQPDVLVGNVGSNDVSLFVNLGKGRFAAPLSFPATFGPRSVAVADLDGDGRVDSVTGNFSQNVSVVLNTSLVCGP
jgi:hypothetical protein